MSGTTTDDLIVMLARRARAARRKTREVEAYHRGLTRKADCRDAIADLMSQRDAADMAADRLETERDEARAEASRLAQELEAARLATQDAVERAQVRERLLVQARAALAEALTRVEAREEEIRRLSNRIDAAERAERVCTDEMHAAFGDVGRLARLTLGAEAEIKRLRREVEIRDAGIEMGVALVRWWEGECGAWGQGQTWMLRGHDADEAARAAHPLARGGS
jgi:chromosome segregation ATPase